ncbi:MAG: hypothetical protein K6E75_04530 [Lachnospiraceae bacterium]|nr:hypothetical protein [Lachnospiraceae bacterium]
MSIYLICGGNKKAVCAICGTVLGVIKGISGTLGIVLTVPCVSLISSCVYGKKNEG